MKPLLVNGQLAAPQSPPRYFFRLVSNGSLDPDFHPAIRQSSEAGFVNQAKVLPGGKIIVAGAFDSVDGISRKGLARLNDNGTLDATFDPQIAGRFAVQSDGKLIVATADGLYRLNIDGSTDPTFQAVLPSPPNSFLVQPDDKVVYTAREPGTYVDRTIVGRLGANGIADPTFHLSNLDNAFLLFVQRDGAILVWTADTSEPGRLNSDGTPDWSFRRGDIGFAVAQQSDGELMTGGPLFTWPYGVRRLFLDGTIDSSFAPDLGLFVLNNNVPVRFELLPNGKYVTAGVFNVMDFTVRRRLAVISRDGTPDTSFEPGDLIKAVFDGQVSTSAVNALAVQPDSKILVSFEAGTSATTADHEALIRVNPDGTRDESFHYDLPQPPGTYDSVGSLFVQPDGKILVQCSEFVRLNPDGSKDAAFLPDESTNMVLLQPDGKIVVTDEHQGLKRLNADGSADTGFTPAGLNMFNHPDAVALQPDGKFLISRLGTSTFGYVFVRLNSDGSADETFKPDVNHVQLIAADRGGIYAAGQIERKGSVPHFGICRFNLDGTRDADFDVSFSENATLTELRVEPDGQLFVTGTFEEVNGVERHGIARVNGNAARKLANISTRVSIGGDSGSAAIVGFIISGSAPTKVIIRALGPSFATSAGSQTITANPGSYTAVIRGKDGGQGLALAEVYNLDSGTDSTLGNISTRGRVGRGNSVMIGGFILRGSEPSTIVLRAVGPSLSSAGIDTALQNPSVVLYDASGVIVGANDDWKEVQQAELERRGFGLSDDREAALILALPTGSYTAVVRGDSGTGTGLVELYDLDYK